MTRHDLLTFDGITQPIIEWALDYGITPETIMRRLNNGMSVERAITKPMPAKPGDRLPELETSGRTKTVTYAGRTMTIAAWADETGLPASTIRSRLSDGWTPQRALKTPHRDGRGAVSNFAASKGTGAGSTAQERLEIDFSDEGTHA